MDIQKTIDYYKNLENDDICQCDYCQQYVKQVKAAYPEVSEYLQKLGVDIEKPFEAMSIDLDDGELWFIAVQYIVMGREEKIQENINGVDCKIARSYPDTNIEEEHFVIEISPIYL